MLRRRRLAFLSFLAVAVAGCHLMLGLDDHALTFDDRRDGSAVPESSTGRDGGNGNGDGAVDSFCRREPAHHFCADFDDNAPGFGVKSIEQKGNASVAFGDAAVSPPSSFMTTTPAVKNGNAAGRLVIDLPTDATSVRVEFDMLLCVPSFGAFGNIEFLKLEQDSDEPEIGIEAAFFETKGVMGIELAPTDGGPIVKEGLDYAAPRTGAWTHVSFEVAVDDVNESIRLVYDRNAAAPAFEKTGIQTRTDALVAMRVKVGVYMTVSEAACTSYFDNLTIDATSGHRG